MLTRRQQFRRCRVRRRSPVKGLRRGSQDGGSSYGTDAGSVDTGLSFRTAHGHGGGGLDSCGVSPLSSAASSPCPPGSPTLSEAASAAGGGGAGRSTLGLAEESSPPPHALSLASPAQLKVCMFPLIVLGDLFRIHST
jgi:hypothetical protein